MGNGRYLGSLKMKHGEGVGLPIPTMGGKGLSWFRKGQNEP